VRRVEPGFLSVHLREGRRAFQFEADLVGIPGPSYDSDVFDLQSVHTPQKRKEPQKPEIPYTVVMKKVVVNGKEVELPVKVYATPPREPESKVNSTAINSVSSDGGVWVRHGMPTTN
jgi:hypothetical protein